MNKLFFLLGLYLTGVSVGAEPISSSLKTPYEPSYFSILMSLICVICIIYVAGIAYNKLNNFNIKALKAQNKDFATDKISIISTTPLGANRTLHVVELNGKKMLIGASANSIHLIKDLSTETNDSIQEESLREQEEYKEVEQENTKEEDEDFGLYKKYLR